MTLAEIEKLLATAKKQSNIANYAKGIKNSIEERDTIEKELHSIPTEDYNRFLDVYEVMRNKERAITLKIRHYFDMVYGKGNIYNTNNKGKGFIQYLWDFQESARIYGVKC